MNPIQFYLEDRYRITSPYGWRDHPITGVRSFHHGTDLGGKPRGYPLRTPFGGIVIGRGFGTIYGNWVAIRSLRAKVVYFFGHLTESTVTVGQTLTPGAVIGGLGATGSATGVHLHFEVRLDDGSNNGGGVWGDPENYFEEIKGVSTMPDKLDRKAHSWEVSGLKWLEEMGYLDEGAHEPQEVMTKGLFGTLMKRMRFAVDGQVTLGQGQVDKAKR